MGNLEQLEVRIQRLEAVLVSQRHNLINEVKKLIERHSHMMSGTVVWKMPPEKLKEALEKLVKAQEFKPAPVGMTDDINMTDEFTFDLKKVTS